MSPQEALRRHILEKNRASGCLYRTDQLSRQFHMPEDYVREVLVDVYEQNLINMATCCGQSELEFKDWPSAQVFAVIQLAAPAAARRLRTLLAYGEIPRNVMERLRAERSY
jgi:hypothetical protein